MKLVLAITTLLLLTGCISLIGCADVPDNAYNHEVQDYEFHRETF